MVKKCPVCKKGKFEKVDNITLEIGGYIFVVDGHRCSECGEEFPLEEAAQKTIEVSRRLGVWPEPLKLYRVLSKSGGGLVLRIPADLERQMRLKSGEEVMISKIGEKIVLEPIEE